MIQSGPGQCTCPVGSVMKQTNTTAENLAFSLSCEQCAPGTYPGPGFWECKTCPDPAMEYKLSGTKYECMCKDGYLTAGDFCVSNADYTALQGEINGPLSATNQVYFRNLLSDSSPVLITSQTISKYFSLSAIGCWKYGDNKSCQSLVNLCVLNLYDMNRGPC